MWLNVRCREYPSCLQTTLASKIDHPSSHTVPQASFMQISTRPSSSKVPPTSLMSPSLHRARSKTYSSELECRHATFRQWWSALQPFPLQRYYTKKNKLQPKRSRYTLRSLYTYVFYCSAHQHPQHVYLQLYSCQNCSLLVCSQWCHRLHYPGRWDHFLDQNRPLRMPEHLWDKKDQKKIVHYWFNELAENASTF